MNKERRLNLIRSRHKARLVIKEADTNVLDTFEDVDVDEETMFRFQKEDEDVK